MARRKRGTFLNKQAPQSLKSKTKRILIWIGAILGILLLLGAAGYMYLLSWLQGDGFRSYLANQIKSRTHAAEVSIPENLTVAGNHMTLPACTLRDAAFIKEFSLRKLHLELNRSALWRRMLHLQHFSVEEMQLVLQLPEKKQQNARPTAPGKKSAPAAQPDNFRARSFESHYTDTTVVLGKREFSLNGYQLVALPRPEIGKNAWAVAIENGRIRTPFSWLKESGVKSATLLYRGEDIQLSDCKIELAPGHLTAKGVYDLNAGLWKGRLDITQANVARILNSDWRKRLTGELWGHLDMNGDTAKGDWEAHGELRLEKGVVEALPFLSDLKINNTTPYRKLRLSKATCQLSFPYSEPEHGLNDAWLCDNIDVRSENGSLVVKGRVIIGTDGKLGGALSVGVPTKMIAELGLSKTPLVSKIFNAPVEMPGYVWTRINLSGTVDDPHEDLSVRLATILPEAVPALADKAVNSLNSVINTFLPDNSDQDNATPPAEGETKQPTTPQRPDRGDKVRRAINTGLDLLF